MRISLGGIFGFLNLFKKKKPENKKRTWIDWARATAVEEVTQNVEKTYKFANINQYLKNVSGEALEELYLGTSLNLTGRKKLSIGEVKDMFDLSLGESAGVMLPEEKVEEIAEYYFDNFYSDETQAKYYDIRQSRK